MMVFGSYEGPRGLSSFDIELVVFSAKAFSSAEHEPTIKAFCESLTEADCKLFVKELLYSIVLKKRAVTDVVTILKCAACRHVLPSSILLDFLEDTSHIQRYFDFKPLLPFFHFQGCCNLEAKIVFCQNLPFEWYCDWIDNTRFLYE